jgi:hypothetical protein
MKQKNAEDKLAAFHCKRREAAKISGDEAGEQR